MTAVLKYPGAKWSMAEWIISYSQTCRHTRRNKRK